MTPSKRPELFAHKACDSPNRRVMIDDSGMPLTRVASLPIISPLPPPPTSVLTSGRFLLLFCFFVVWSGREGCKWCILPKYPCSFLPLSADLCFSRPFIQKKILQIYLLTPTDIISTPRRELAPAIEEDEEPESESQGNGPAPLRQIESNISAILRGEVSIARVPGRFFAR